MSVPTTSKYFINTKEIKFKNSNNALSEKPTMLQFQNANNVKCEKVNSIEDKFESKDSDKKESDKVAFTKSVNETDGNGNGNSIKKKKSIKSKYFQNEKWSFEQSTTTLKTKSLSEKLKSISENLSSTNTNSSDIPTNSETNCNQFHRDATSDIATQNNSPEGDKPNKKAKKKRFDGVPESEILQMTLPDLILPDLDVLIVGINPGLETAYRQHYYAGPGNHFWQCMALAGILPSSMAAEDDVKLKDFGIGFTNVVERTTRGQADLSKKELLEGCAKLREKIVQFKPKIVAFNGKYIYELFSGSKEFSLGLQPGVIGEDIAAFQFVMPSSSARCSHLPRAQDKVPFFKGLKKMMDLVRGDSDNVEDEDVKFPAKLKTGNKRTNLQSKS